MEIKYTVASCTEDPVEVVATVAGREVMATVMGLVVDCVSECGGMGHTFRFRPDDIEAAKKQFVIGAPIVATFTFPDAE